MDSLAYSSASVLTTTLDFNNSFDQQIKETNFDPFNSFSATENEPLLLDSSVSEIPSRNGRDESNFLVQLYSPVSINLLIF